MIPKYADICFFISVEDGGVGMGLLIRVHVACRIDTGMQRIRNFPHTIRSSPLA